MNRFMKISKEEIKYLFLSLRSLLFINNLIDKNNSINKQFNIIKKGNIRSY